MEENTKDLDNIKIYELGYHLIPTINEESLGVEVSKLQTIISENGGNIISEEFPQMKNLSYEISKVLENKYNRFNRSYFGWMKFEADSSVIGEIDKKVTSNPSVLRFLIVKTVKENTIYTPKIISKKEIKPEEGSLEIPVEKASPEEIDKSIDDLLVEETK